MKKPDGNFRASISLLDPRRPELMSVMARILNIQPQDLALSIEKSLRELTSKEVAKMLGICTDTVMVWHRAGLLNGRVANDKGEYLFDFPKGNLPPKRPGEKLYVRKKS
ncbi:MAG: hypothetical protein AB1480_15195 [Nitrospirota bacterium]